MEFQFKTFHFGFPNRRNFYKKSFTFTQCVSVSVHFRQTYQWIRGGGVDLPTFQLVENLLYHLYVPDGH